MRFLTFCKTYALCFRVVGAIFFVCAYMFSHRSQMRTDAVRGDGDNPTGRAVGAADSRFWACGERFYEGGLRRHSFRLHWAMRYLDILPAWLSCRRKNVTLLHVTCYNKHLPYVRTFFRKPEFGGCKKYIVYIIYILYILYIFYKPILRNMEPPYCNM